jgi:hypothetical protein
MLTGVFEVRIELALQLLVHIAGKCDAAGFAKRLKPRSNFDTVTVDVVPFDDHVTDVDT